MLLKYAIFYIWKIILQDVGAWRAPLTSDLQPSFILLLEIILQVFHINCSIQQTNTGVEAPVSPRREVFTFSLKVISNFPPCFFTATYFLSFWNKPKFLMCRGKYHYSGLQKVRITFLVARFIAMKCLPCFWILKLFGGIFCFII